MTIILCAVGGIIIGLSFNYTGHIIECSCKKTKLNFNPFIAAIVGGFILAFLGAYFPLTLFSGEHTLREVINNVGELGIPYLAFIAFLKILATKISINFIVNKFIYKTSPSL